MNMKLGVVMDPIASINPKKDSTLAMLIAAQKKGYALFYMEQKDLFVQQGELYAQATRLTVHDDVTHWFDLYEQKIINAKELNVILMRKDPPFDMEYIYTTQLLELAERQGVSVVNKPQSLRDANEKLFTTWFSDICPPTLITRDANLLREFIQKQKQVVLKPLDGMGGRSIFLVTEKDLNNNVIIETLTHLGQQFIMAQRYIPEIKNGDKRILLINGVPIDFCLARIPGTGDFRGNLAVGGHGVVQPLTERDYYICRKISPILREKGLLFVGIDVIGDYLTEINVTSPTCIKEIEAETNLKIADKLIEALSRSH